MPEYILLALVGFLAGAMNAAAGGGTFVSVPALIAAGVPSVSANMTSTIALCPGAFTSAYTFRKDFRAFGDASPLTLLLLSIAGGAAGALLLILTPGSAFDGLIPWLLLTGSIAFAFGRRIGEFLRARMTLGKTSLVVVQFMRGVYGGSFGGAVGLMMLAAWTIFGARDLVAMSAVRILVVACANATAILFFLAAGVIYWPQCFVMMAAGVAGGHFGARIAQKIPVHSLRAGISCLNFIITAIFFWKTFLG